MDAISSPVQAVIDLFADSLRDVRFGDVDAGTLAELAASAHAAAEIVTTVEAELCRARRALQERQDALFVHAQRALAYARVYAEADAALTEKLDQISLPRVAKRPRMDGDVLVLQPDVAPRNRRSTSETGDVMTPGPKGRRNPTRRESAGEAVPVPELTSVG